MSRMKMTALLACGLGLQACVHSVHEVHVSDFSEGISRNRAQVVSSEAEQFTLLGFVSETEYVDFARKDLLSKCPNGRIEGITTQYSTALGFFSWKNKILMKGYCVTAAGKTT